MLDAYNIAKTQAGKREVMTSHGNAAEAIFRKWLSEFLPKRYNVSSGFIVSQGLGDNDKLPHYDVIIYDQLEAPILWIESTPDQSDEGRSLAIPAEHVMAVLEVKATLTTTSIGNAIDHLIELRPLMIGIDHPDEPYKRFLPPNFFCSIIFFELEEKSRKSFSILEKFTEGFDLRGFREGITLRGEGHSKPLTGVLDSIRSPQKVDWTTDKNRSLLEDMIMCTKKGDTENNYYGTSLCWSERMFAKFAFDMIASFKGKYIRGLISSFHGL